MVSWLVTGLFLSWVQAVLFLLFPSVLLGRHRRRGANRLIAEQPGPALLSEPVAIAADHHHMAVMQQPVEDRGGSRGSRGVLRPWSRARTDSSNG